MRETLTTYQQKTLDLIALATEANPIKGRDIANRIGLKPRDSGKDGADMRSVINALRVKGYPICATGDGYYYARTSEELSKFISEFQGRVDKQQLAVNGLKNGFEKLGYQPNTPEPIRPTSNVFEFASSSKARVVYRTQEIAGRFVCDCPSYNFRHSCKHTKFLEDRARLNVCLTLGL